MMSDRTDDRIRAYLASVVPLRGSGVEDRYYRGLSFIQKMALSAKDAESPTIVLSVDQCADVIHFLWATEPLEPIDWWKDPEDAPSHAVGLMIIQQTVEKSLRKGGGSGTPPEALSSDHVDFQRASELNEIMSQIDGARGVVELAFQVLLDFDGRGSPLAAHAASALSLANEELQRVREAVEALP